MKPILAIDDNLDDLNKLVDCYQNLVDFQNVNLIERTLEDVIESIIQDLKDHPRKALIVDLVWNPNPNAGIEDFRRFKRKAYACNALDDSVTLISWSQYHDDYQEALKRYDLTFHYIIKKPKLPPEELIRSFTNE